jgi:hypothetical protein
VLDRFLEVALEGEQLTDGLVPFDADLVHLLLSFLQVGLVNLLGTFKMLFRLVNHAECQCQLEDVLERACFLQFRNPLLDLFELALLNQFDALLFGYVSSFAWLGGDNGVVWEIVLVGSFVVRLLAVEIGE